MGGGGRAGGITGRGKCRGGCKGRGEEGGGHGPDLHHEKSKGICDTPEPHSFDATGKLNGVHANRYSFVWSF